MTVLDTNLENREEMLIRLRAEVVGPDPAGNPMQLSDNQDISWEEFRTARRQVSGEEIVWQDPPTKRFGAGILFPQGADDVLAETAAEDTSTTAADSSDLRPEGMQSEEASGLSERERQAQFDNGDDADDEGVTLANAFRPSALGLSFLADLGQEAQGLCVELVSVGRVGSNRTIERPCGTYRPITLRVGAALGKEGAKRKVWLREPVVTPDGKVPRVKLTTQELLDSAGPIKRWMVEELNLCLVVVVRKWRGAPSLQHRLITASLVNMKSASSENLDTACLFQVGLRMNGLSNRNWIDPYPEYLIGEFADPDPLADENVNRVIYRANRNFAIGHGCGADWVHGRPDAVASVWTDVLPVFETPSTSADLILSSADGTRQKLRVSMRKLAGLDSGDDGLADADRLLKEYRTWIDNLQSSVSGIPSEYRPTATALLLKCIECADRVHSGLELLRAEGQLAETARLAFRLANHAMLLAQLRARQPLRLPAKDTAGRWTWEPPITVIDASIPSESQGFWRPFQIAFLLMSLRGIVDDTHAERQVVDLIWFPTGGGKTEAYLGLTAFTVFFNALSGTTTAGVDVLMRYTLRLLTAQQFQRAATLFCAMEHLRRLDPVKLGRREFRIGLWVGSSATPNRRDDALAKLRALQSDPDAENPYVLLRCPWCAAKFGPHEFAAEGAGSGRRPARRGRTHAPTQVFGYVKERLEKGETVVYRCGDADCEFGGRPGLGARTLPIVVIDEDLLDSPPNLLIGTVDKFAMLAWTPAARSIFGVGPDGRHTGAPPSLIIQDELHLISGPLGSMVGAYETVIELLCVDPLGGMVRPKIVASTATISRAREQVKGLYGRDAVALFPPAGLDAADSFFAREATDDEGNPRPGRLYAGVLAPGHGSVQTSEARIFATLMQQAALLKGEPADLDPWWTLLVFFNSLRELGGALTLFSADTREYLRVVLTRHGIDYTKIRQLFNVEELTSRIRGDHIPRLLERLEVPLSSREGRGAEHGASPIDACLASNIIEVGVDITRLALMVIVGQPKTTSQYIQVSSRVGRDTDKPGLVVVIYGQTKPRDRSHYENFRAYHQKLYAQVEPTSVTPFSPPAVERSLHGLIVAVVRQLGDQTTVAARPDPFPLASGSDLRTRVEELIRDRVRAVAPHEEANVMDRLRQRLNQWRVWHPGEYGRFGRPPDDAPLMHPAGSTERAEWEGRSWPTVSSLRNVDASCEADVTGAYLGEEGASA
jgi:hypothetical protein